MGLGEEELGCCDIEPGNAVEFPGETGEATVVGLGPPTFGLAAFELAALGAPTFELADG
jgi:hypothetical protein